MTEHSVAPRQIARQIVGLLLLPSLIFFIVIFLWQQLGFLPARFVAEIAGIVLATTAFIVGVMLKGFSRTEALSTLAIGLGWSAVLSLLHALTYPGMGLLRVDEQSVSATLSLSARWVEAMAVLLGGLHNRRVLSSRVTRLVFAILTPSLAIVAFTDWAPALYRDVLTPSAISLIVGLIIVGILLREIVLIWRRSPLLSTELRVGLTMAFLFFVAAEVVNLVAIDPFGMPMLLSQSLTLFMYWLVYQMIVKTRLVEPYDRLAHVSKIYDAVIDPMLLVDRNGTIKTANLAAGRVLGVSPELLIGKSSHLLFHNTEAESADCVVCRSLKQGQALDRHEISRKHGASLLQVSVNRVEEADDAELYVEVLHDLNELAHMRQDLALATGIVAQQRAALEALSALQERNFDMADWIQSLSKVFRAPSLVRVYWSSSSSELGMPPPAKADTLACQVGENESQGKLIVYYPEAPDNVTVGFDTTERALFEMLSSALRAKLNP